MTANEIRKWSPMKDVHVAIEIAAQLAEMNELRREELALRQTGIVNERLTGKARRLTQALLATNKRIREDLSNHQSAGHSSLAVKRLQEQLERNEEMLAEK
jgi:hypothetical protein